MCFAQFGSSKRCVCPLYKFLYAFKVVKLFLKHPIYDTYILVKFSLHQCKDVRVYILTQHTPQNNVPSVLLAVTYKYFISFTHMALS